MTESTEQADATDRSQPDDTGRDARGRFGPGNAGRPKGARHRATVAVETLLQGEAEALTRKAVEVALTGDVQALRLCLERLCPSRKPEGRTVELPGLAEAATPADQARAVIAAVAGGEIPVDVGEALLGGISAVCRIVEIAELESRIAALEAAR